MSTCRIEGVRGGVVLLNPNPLSLPLTLFFFYICHVHPGGGIKKYVAGIILIIDGSPGSQGQMALSVRPPSRCPTPPPKEVHCLQSWSGVATPWSPISQQRIWLITVVLRQGSMRHAATCISTYNTYSISPNSCPQLPKLPCTMRCGEKTPHFLTLTPLYVNSFTKEHHFSPPIKSPMHARKFPISTSTLTNPPVMWWCGEMTTLRV
jgi:hypothetical protein